MTESQNKLNVRAGTANDAAIVQILFDENLSSLHCESISRQEWRDLLSANDPDEKHFLICKNTDPVGYMKINGLLNSDTAWISMLFVSQNLHRQGIGSFAVTYAEEFIKSEGHSRICIQTTDDNTAAKRLYEKCGYTGVYDSQKQKWRYTKVTK